MAYKVFAFLSALAVSFYLLVSPVLAAEVGTYPMVCDYKVETDSGDIVYIPSKLASDEFHTLIVNRTVASGGYTVVASNSGSLWPLITIDEAGYYKSWLNWDANSNADTYIFSPAAEQGQTIDIVVDSVSSTGTALGTDTAGDYVSWSNYNVLDNTGNLYHARNDVVTVPDDGTESGSDTTVNVDVDLSEVQSLLEDTKGLLSEVNVQLKDTNVVLMALLFLLCAIGAVGLFRSLIGR